MKALRATLAVPLLIAATLGAPERAEASDPLIFLGGAIAGGFVGFFVGVSCALGFCNGQPAVPTCDPTNIPCNKKLGEWEGMNKALAKLSVEARREGRDEGYRSTIAEYGSHVASPPDGESAAEPEAKAPPPARYNSPSRTGGIHVNYQNLAF